MPYTPVELRHVRIGKSLFGYDREAVEQLLIEVADSFEEVWRERGELEDRVELLEKQTEELRRREQSLANALVAAEQAASEVREHAKREAELIIAEAHQEARSIARGAQGEHARLAAEVRRMEALLRAALGMVEESAHGAPAEEPAPERKPDSWPRRDDTREFPRPVRRVEGPHSEPEARAG
ncbi:MAG: DivIVA domain-containing protein [Actinobacteria bacterium]|nr:DivIVA domain-containing protein [Actinomycetota bacterium]